MGLTQEQIAVAIRHEGWQKFRKDLKGTSTETKIERLNLYCDAVEYVRDTTNAVRKLWWQRKYGEPPKPEQARVQILNYLNALSRGGQIEPLPKQDWEYDELAEFLNDELDTKIKIRR